MAVTIRNRDNSNSSSIATRLSAKVNTKVRSLVSKFEFLGRNSHGASKVQNQPQHPRSKQRRSTIASIRQTLDHNRAPASKAGPGVEEDDDEEEFPMRIKVTHTFGNAGMGQPKKSVVKRCASMFDRLAKDRAMVLEGRSSQIHVLATSPKQKPPRLTGEPKAASKGKGAMRGGVRALIKVFNRQPLSADTKAIVGGPKPTHQQGSSVGMCGDLDLEMVDRSSFTGKNSPVTVYDESYLLARKRSADQGHPPNGSHCHPTHVRQSDFAGLSEISASHEGRSPAATLLGLDTFSSLAMSPGTHGERLNSLPLPLTPMLYRVRRNRLPESIEDRNSKDGIASCISCRPHQYEPRPCAGPSSQTSHSLSISPSSYELPILQMRRSSLGGFSTSSSECASTPRSELELHRKGTPLPESWSAAHCQSIERFGKMMSAPRPGFPNGYWDLAVRIVTEGDADFYDDSSDEEESEGSDKVPQHIQEGRSSVVGFHSGIRKVLQKQSGRINSQGSGVDDCVYVSGATSPRRSLEPFSQVVSAPSSYGCGYVLGISASSGYNSMPGASDPESTETSRDMPLGEIDHLLGRSLSLNQNTTPKRVRIPVYGMPPTKILSPKPDMYHNTTKDIRHLIFRWS
ncbi:hypothetical protein FGG08_000779 [Glutinoglossum americanum]|uniref:Uncharacterized protein n=1 Tax=Glutinoglossum americanum TaxID=1670608 RepID=A0A9P8IG05_9PEZI|nr:hypothetical protein FGG08_000779 [Glutinoglossum americanum]